MAEWLKSLRLRLSALLRRRQLEQDLQDLRFAAWALGEAAGFAFVVVLTLALGIGANTAYRAARGPPRGIVRRWEVRRFTRPTLSVDDNVVRGATALHSYPSHLGSRLVERDLTTRTFGSRPLDVLHVATARELGLPYFLTFDRRRQPLARATGLKLTTPGT